jgi:hypothetical protein
MARTTWFLCVWVIPAVVVPASKELIATKRAFLVPALAAGCRLAESLDDPYIIVAGFIVCPYGGDPSRYATESLDFDNALICCIQPSIS